MERNFKIGLLDYRLSICSLGEVRLELMGGVTKKGVARRDPRLDLFWDEPIYEDVDLGVETFRVLNMVKRYLLEFVACNKPWRISFGASTVRKVPVYRWMARRLEQSLGDYFLIEDPVGRFSFYRRRPCGPGT